MTVNTDTPVGTVVDGLREIADWLEANPDLTPASAHVYIAAKDRGDLEQLAAALGDRAEESQPSYSKDVQICGRFGEHSRVYATVPLSKLADAPPVPEYEPIIPETQDQIDAAISDAVGHGHEDAVRDRYGDERVDDWFRRVDGVDPDAMRADS